MDSWRIVRSAYCVLLCNRATGSGRREAIQMERIIFLFMILGGLYWLIHRVHNSQSSKSSRRPLAGSSDYASSAGSMNLHATPGNNLLADNNKIWKARCQHMGGTVNDSNARDDHSSVNRHHLILTEEEEHIGGWDSPKVKFKPSKTQQTEKH